MSMVYFILLLGGLIFFHEFGHFIVARMCGVRVLVFSLGFGPRWTVYRSPKTGTEYCLSALPLGGYVKMFGEDPTEPLDASMHPDAFTSKPLYQRFLIVLAGPLFNLILPVFIFFFMAFGQPVYPALLGTVLEGGPAYAEGLRDGDRVVAIDGEEIQYWWQLQSRVAASPGESLELTYERAGKRHTVTVTPSTVRAMLNRDVGATEEVGRIRVMQVFVRPVIHVESGTAAERAGLRSWDRVIAIDGQPVEAWFEVSAALAERGLDMQRWTVVHLEDVPAGGALGMATWSEAEEITWTPALDANVPAGVESAELFVHSVQPGTPAADAIGLQPGDELLSFNGTPIQSWALMVHMLHDAPETEHQLEFRRGGQVFSETFTPLLQLRKGEFNLDIKEITFGAENFCRYEAPVAVPNESVLSLAAHNAIERTWKTTKITVLAVAGLFVGQVSYKELGGPILIGQLAAKTTDLGWTYFFTIMVFLSINLGLLNLLPIPMLDGGHLMFFAIEAVKRSPVSMRTRQVASYLGLSFIILLMVLVMANDIERSWDSIVSVFTG